MSIRKTFYSGLVILLPITIALMVFFWLVTFLSIPFLSFATFAFESLDADLEKHAFILLWISRFFACICLLALPLFVGFLAKNRAFFFFTVDRFFLRIPIIRAIYRFSLDIVKATIGTHSTPFKKSATLLFPQENSLVAGFVIGSAPPQMQKNSVDTVFFIPTAPYPLSNFLLLTSQDKIHEISLSTEELFQFSLSCGLIFPKSQ